MITFLKKKGQDQTEAYIDLEEKLAAILKASSALTSQFNAFLASSPGHSHGMKLTLSLIDQNLIPLDQGD